MGSSSRMSLPWENNSSSSGSKPWESNARSSGTKPWERNSSTSSNKPWESSSSSSGNKPWESTSNTSGNKPWESTAITKKQPWISEKEFNSWFKETFPAIKDDGTSLLNDFGLKDFVLHDFGTIKIPDTAGAIAALLISAASIVGGVALIVVSAGAASPAVAAGWGALAGTVLGVGLSGTVNASMGLANKNFKWESWGTDVGITAAASLITFPTTFFGGQAVAGVLMQMSAKVSANVAKAVATTVGGLVGSGVHSGAYVLQCSVDGRPIEPLGVVLSGVGGLFEGTSAAYLGAKLVVTKFNPYKGVKTMKFGQDNSNVEVWKLPDDSMEAAALKEIEAGTIDFPEGYAITEMKADNLKRFKELFGCGIKSEGSAATGDTVSAYRKSTWNIFSGEIYVDDAIESVEVLGRALEVDPKWVRISSQSRKAQNVLFRNQGKDLLFLEHAGPSGYGAFNADEAADFARMVKGLKIPGGGAPSTVTLLGCDVPQDFALQLQDELFREFDRVVVRVKTLPFADEGTILARNLEINTWDYWKRIPDIDEFERVFPNFEDRLYRTPIDPQKPYLSDEVIMKSAFSMTEAEAEILKANTNFYAKMFNTMTSVDLPNHAVFVS